MISAFVKLDVLFKMIGPRLRQGSCRLCLWESNSLWDIFGELAERRNFVRKIQACVNINVSKDDGLSSLICPNCIYKIELFYDFQTSCKRSDEIQKRYNGYQDGEFSDCDAVEEQVHPTPALHCAVSTSHKDVHGPIETIDIKEEPIDDYEVAVDGVDDEQFEDAEVEVVSVEEERLEEGISVTEHHQQTEKDKGKEGVGGGNGSCMQLTPPRSPSVMSEATYSASESAGSAVSDSPEEVEQQQQQNRKDGQLECSSGGLGRESGGRSCGHCAECHPDPHTCQDHELSCSCRNGPDHRQRQEAEEVVHPTPQQLTEYDNRCRFCKKRFQTVDICRTHETECAPLNGSAPPQKLGTGRRCRFCLVLFLSESGRALHEHHCVLRECHGEIFSVAAPQTGGNPRRDLPPPPKYIRQCRFCRKYFPRIGECRIHEFQCGIQAGYTLSQLQTLPTYSAMMNPTGGRRCSLCSKMLKTAGGRQRHEYYCKRNSTQVRSVSTPKPHSANHLVLSQCLSREHSCTVVPASSDGLEGNPMSLSGGQDVIKCRYCGKGHLKWRSLMTHEFHCRRKVPLRAEANAQVGTRTVEMDPNPEAAVSGGGRGNRDETVSLEGNTASKNQRQDPQNQCTYCHKWFRTKSMSKVHEYYCSRNVRMSVRGRYKCSFCPRRFLKRNTYHMHMRHCCNLPDRTSKSVTVSRAEPTGERAQRQLPQMGCETALGKDKSNDRQEVIPTEPEEKRKKVSTPFYTPLSVSNKETDIQTCQYCDRSFKYRECLRSHEVTCSAIATYQYHRSPSFFKCPLCKKSFKFRRKLRNHWKVCRARTSVVAEASELNSDAKLGQARSVQSKGSGSGGAVMLPFGNTSSPGEDREEWRGWPSSQSPTVVDLVTDEESNSSVADSCELSCKLCKKNFCSRVLLELHTLNECVYQRIRNDHAYAQCESSGIDESTLMRMARVELQRLLLCSCCGSIFTDRQALAEHERSQRQSRMTTDNLLQYSHEATHIQKRIKLGKVADELGLKQAGGQEQSSCRLQHQATSDQVVPTKITKLVNTDSRQDSNKNCLLQDIPCNNDNKQIVRKVTCEIQAKEEVSIKQQEWQQLGSMDCKLGSNNNSVLRDCVRNNCNLQLKEDLSEKVSPVDNGLKQDRQSEVLSP